LLLQGGTLEIVYTTLLYALGCVLLAVAIQGTVPIGRRGIGLPHRVLFGLGGAAFMFPATIWVDLAGLALTLTAIALLRFMPPDSREPTLL
jgi:hypothetical protein